jgi:hypothetical protein
VTQGANVDDVVSDADRGEAQGQAANRSLINEDLGTLRFAFHHEAAGVLRQRVAKRADQPGLNSNALALGGDESGCLHDQLIFAGPKIQLQDAALDRSRLTVEQ